MGYADGATFGSCAAALWHGLRLDSVTDCYILVLPFFVAVIGTFFSGFPLRKVLKPYYWIVAVLMALLFIADIVLYHFWGAKLDAADLIYAQSPKDMLASVSWLSIVAGVVVIALFIWHYYRRLCHATIQVCDKWKNWRWPLFTIPLAGLLFLGMRGGVSESTANPSYAYFSKYQFCNHSALNPLFNMLHSLTKTEDLANQFVFMPEEEVSAMLEPCFETDEEVSLQLLNTGRPDILLIVWEGGGWDMVMNDSVGPNITRFSREGVLFTNCYANNFRTDRGLVSLLNGWMGLPTTSLMKMNDKCRALPSLARQLRQGGYDTRFVYGGDIDFTNMRGYLHETGFLTALGSEHFADAKHLSNWGAPDAYTLLPEVVTVGNTPWFSVVLTLSSHEPWEVPMRRLADNRKNSFVYADSCIGVLVDALRVLPIWNNLLVIIVPDHGVSLSSSQSTSDPRVSHIPMVWLGGAVKEPCVVDAMMNQSDLAMTLLSQLAAADSSFRFESRFPFSRNVLSPSYKGNYHFVMHSFKNGCNLIDSTGITRIDCLDNSSVSNSGEESVSRERFARALLQYIYKKTSELK